MDAIAILEQLQHHGIGIRVMAGKLLLEPGSKVPVELIAEVKLHKPELLAYLTQPEPTGAEIADSVDASLCLGQRLARGEITVVRCGITGSECRHCKGIIPCLGSTPLDSDARG